MQDGLALTAQSAHLAQGPTQLLAALLRVVCQTVAVDLDKVKLLLIGLDGGGDVLAQTAQTLVQL